MMSKCPKCNSFRSIESHLFELSELCRYLNNKVNFKRKEQERIVNTKVIGDWLKFASHLKNIEVDWWRFRGSEMSNLYCSSDVDEEAADEEHFSFYSTALTRFIYATNALEEGYRFIDHAYEALESVKAKAMDKRLKEPSMRAAKVIDELPINSYPKYFSHSVDNLSAKFERYLNHSGLKKQNIIKSQKKSKSYGLDIIRNLRNHVAHGVFPIIDNPLYWGGEEKKQNLLFLLGYATRVIGLYIQVILMNYGKEFESEDYFIVRDWDEESNYFESNCQLDLSKTLHLKENEFSFSHPLDPDPGY